jgi:hypothetical protein
MMFLEGYIAAPPTITVFSSARAGATTVDVSASALKATAENRAIRLDMEGSPNLNLLRPADVRLTWGQQPRLVADLGAVVAANYGRVLPAVSEIILCDS